MQNPPLLHVYNASGWLCPADSPKTALRSSCGCQVPHAADVPAGACKTTSTRAVSTAALLSLEVLKCEQCGKLTFITFIICRRCFGGIFGFLDINGEDLLKRSWAECQWEAFVLRLMYSSLEACPPTLMSHRPFCPVPGHLDYYLNTLLLKRQNCPSLDGKPKQKIVV